MDSSLPSRTLGAGVAPRFETVAALCLTIAAAYQLALVLQPVRFLCEYVLIDDDTYYYLRIARELALHGRASFDGIHASNGVQFSWAALLVALARAVPGEIDFARAALACGVVLNVVAGVQFAKLGRRLHSPACGATAVVIWSGAMVARVPTLTGMEYPLDIVILLASCLVAWRLWREPAALDRRRLAAALGLVALIVWTRLDAAPFALLLWLLLARAVRHSSRGTRRLVRVAVLVAVPLAAAGLYLATSYALAGTWVPISGLVKAHHAAQHFASHSVVLALAGHLLWWLSIPLRSTLALVYPWLLRGPLPQHAATFAAAAAVSGVLVFALARLARRGTAPNRHAATALLTLGGLGVLHAALVVAALGHFAHVTARYFGPLAIAVTLAAGLLAARLEPRPARRGAALLLLFAAWLAADLWRVATPDDGNLRVRRLALARWIDHNLPREARIGAWNAGQLGYFSHRPVVNLDGLANDRAYLDFLRSGRPLREYLERERIDFLADYDAEDLSMPFRFHWDHDEEFRGALPWSALVVLRADVTAAPPLYLVRLADAPAAVSAAGASR